MDSAVCSCKKESGREMSFGEIRNAGGTAKIHGQKNGRMNVAGFEWRNLISENSLIFSSLEFLFQFLPLFLLAYLLPPRKGRSVTLFLGSILLYACCEPFFVLLLLLMTGVNFLIGRNLAAQQEGNRRFWLILGVVVNLVILVFFKAGNRLNENLLLPLGISFYIFKAVSYLADVYRGRIYAERSFWRFGAYLCFFAQITSGPIMRMETAAPALRGQSTGTENESGSALEEAIRLLVLGLAAKVLLADRLGILWNEIQTVGFESISTPLAWLGAFAYSLQLYFDFEGYSLMAVGIGMLFGFPFVRNFDQPYAAVSVSDFWRRWHMTLGSWFRDYVYIPLGGNRSGRVRTVLNLAFVWVLTGLWHGVGVNFLIWGLTLGLLVILEKLTYGKWIAGRKVFSHVYVCLIIPLTWVIFAVEDPAQLAMYFGRLFPFFGMGETLNAGEIFRYLADYWYLLLAAAVFCIPKVSAVYEKKKRKWYVTAVLLILFWICVYQLTNAANNPFLYFRF